ncbi:hypothetical protein Aduo_018754 [Ancylostoma duodenale]
MSGSSSMSTRVPQGCVISIISPLLFNKIVDGFMRIISKSKVGVELFGDYKLQISRINSGGEKKVASQMEILSHNEVAPTAFRRAHMVLMAQKKCIYFNENDCIPGTDTTVTAVRSDLRNFFIGTHRDCKRFKRDLLIIDEFSASLYGNESGVKTFGEGVVTSQRRVAAEIRRPKWFRHLRRMEPLCLPQKLLWMVHRAGWKIERKAAKKTRLKQIETDPLFLRMNVQQVKILKMVRRCRKTNTKCLLWHPVAATSCAS